jgi:hypothetical protein
MPDLSGLEDKRLHLGRNSRTRRHVKLVPIGMHKAWTSWELKCLSAFVLVISHF